MPLYIEEFEWLDWAVEKIAMKHSVRPEEVEEAFFNEYRVRRAEEGKFRLYGRSDAGRYLFIVFAWRGRNVRVISARDMTASEHRYFGRS